MSAPHSTAKTTSVERLADVFFRRRRLLVGLGLVVRLLTSGFYGTQDVEWWKAWGSFAVTHGMVGVYGASDRDMISFAKARASMERSMETDRNCHTVRFTQLLA
jgi:hypothetical protein